MEQANHLGWEAPNHKVRDRVRLYTRDLRLQIQVAPAYRVCHLLDSKQRAGRLQYMASRECYSPEENSWVVNRTSSVGLLWRGFTGPVRTARGPAPGVALLAHPSCLCRGVLVPLWGSAQSLQRAWCAPDCRSSEPDLRSLFLSLFIRLTYNHDSSRTPVSHLFHADST